MEIINDNRIPDSQGRRTSTNMAGNIYLGIVLILAGTLWLFYNIDLIGYSFFKAVFSWQMLLIVIGGYLIAVRRWIAGIITAALGVFAGIFVILDFDISFSRIILPIVIIITGIAVIASRLERKR